MGKSMMEEFALLTVEEQEAVIAALDPEAIKMMARGEWWWTARPEQIPPPGNWTVHLYLAGRGAGKTRSGSEWLVQRCIDHPYDTSGFPTERLVVAYNISDTRSICVEGASGILRVLQRRGYTEAPYHHQGSGKGLYRYVSSPKPHIKLVETGVKIHFTGADPDACRGFNLADVWMDEPGKWNDCWNVWREGIRPALRADVPGDKPRAFVTTTPKPIKLLQHWLAQNDGKISLVRGSTFDNTLNLSQDFLEEVKTMYEGTLLGRQELFGEMLDNFEGPLFSMGDINAARLDIGPEKVLHRVVAVDPNLTGDEDGDEMGVIVACRGSDDHIYVIADETVNLSGREAALHAWHVFARYQADVLVVEDNLGKAWLAQVMTDTFNELARQGFFPGSTTPPLKRIHSNQGKKLRAEPVALRYQQHRVHHLGRFEKLEDEMVAWDPISSKESPDRLDALVHACNHLMAGERRKMRISVPKVYPIPQSQYGVNSRQ